jgi:hypothetical protein
MDTSNSSDVVIYLLYGPAENIRRKKFWIVNYPRLEIQVNQQKIFLYTND